MIIDKYINRLKQINGLIQRRSTGNPKEFARKLDISERTLYEQLKYLKMLGLPILYNKSLNSYIYCNEDITVQTHTLELTKK